MKEETKRKKNTAIIVTIILCVFFAIFMIFPLLTVISTVSKITGALGIQALFGVIIISCLLVVLRKRLEDLDNGEEDDLDKY